ncbi:MAG: A/G-specific adenine glycosylase [Eubacteriales bacterium]|jgi:A/G-specific adenine glycosylase
MEDQERIGKAAEPLLAWYRVNARDLPWRREPTPYRVWVSEIMLQQTRVETVKPYFERFMKAFPTVEALAQAEEQQLLKLWEGLGYYSRARNLQKAARQVMTRYGGQLPPNVKELQSLDGIGSYTAGAIASIAYGLSAPAVDGNLLRVFARLCGWQDDIALPQTKQKLERLLEQVLQGLDAGAFNQAVMDVGATLCIPGGGARCHQCPMAQWCVACATGQQGVLPVKSPKKPRQIEQKTVLLLSCDGCVALRQRPAKGMLANLWEFPNEEGWLSRAQIQRLLESWGAECDTPPELLGKAKHIFTHREWHMEGWLVELRNMPLEDCVWVTPQELDSEYSLPAAFGWFKQQVLQPRQTTLWTE